MIIEHVHKLIIDHDISVIMTFTFILAIIEHTREIPISWIRIKIICTSKGGKTRSSYATQSWRATLAVQPLYVMVRHCVGCVARLHVIVARQGCFVSVRLYTAVGVFLKLHTYAQSYESWKYMKFCRINGLASICFHKEVKNKALSLP